MRDDIRTAILTAKPKTKIITVFGIEVELRQSAVGELMADAGTDPEVRLDKADAFAHLLIRSCYVPGTNEKVFDEADVDALKQIPFGPELTTLQSAINDLLGVDVQTERKN